MNESIFIVKGYDADVEETFEFEEGNQESARLVYASLRDQDGITDLHILEYNLVTMQYHLITS